MKIRVLSRKSDLAIIQAYEFGNYFLSKFPEIKIEYVTKSTSGDKDLVTPLSEMPSEGVFTNDLRDELIRNECDLIVHSWKDLPIEVGEQTKISATLKRSDMRDILFVKKNKNKKNDCINILCSSPRRKYNLENFIKNYTPEKYKKINFKNIRGNIPTRFKKFINDSKNDGFVVAKAAIDRILNNQNTQFEELRKELKHYIDQCLWTIVPLSINPCSPGQGALAIETRINDENLNSLLEKVNYETEFKNVESERKILSDYGGGCHQKIGVSYISHKHGLIISKRGENQDGKHFESWNLENINNNKNQCENKEEIYPESLENYKIFERKQIDVSISKINNLSNNCIFISRANALPKEAKISSENIIWTSGLSTWKQLSSRGIWVNGSSDGLGENFENNLSALTSFSWIKLTHKDAPISKIIDRIETYKLERLDLKINTNKKYFYWMSSSAFQYSIEKYPEIKDKYHYCGPGNTYNEIYSILGNNKNLFVELSYDTWKEKLLTR